MIGEAILAAGGFRKVMTFLGIGVLVIAVLAWFIGWIKDKIA